MDNRLLAVTFGCVELYVMGDWMAEPWHNYGIKIARVSSFNLIMNRYKTLV